MNTISISRISLAALIFISSSSAFAVATTHKCKVTGVFENEARVHLRCDKAAGAISFFAVPIAKGTHSKNFLSVSTAAMLSGRTVEVFYDTNDTSGTAYGCNASDCRAASAMEMR